MTYILQTEVLECREVYGSPFYINITQIAERVPVTFANQPTGIRVVSVTTSLQAAVKNLEARLKALEVTGGSTSAKPAVSTNELMVTTHVKCTQCCRYVFSCIY